MAGADRQPRCILVSNLQSKHTNQTPVSPKGVEQHSISCQHNSHEVPRQWGCRKLCGHASGTCGPPNSTPRELGDRFSRQATYTVSYYRRSDSLRLGSCSDPLESQLLSRRQRLFVYRSFSLPSLFLWVSLDPINRRLLASLVRSPGPCLEGAWRSCTPAYEIFGGIVLLPRRLEHRE